MHVLLFPMERWLFVYRHRRLYPCDCMMVDENTTLAQNSSRILSHQVFGEEMEVEQDLVAFVIKNIIHSTEAAEHCVLDNSVCDVRCYQIQIFPQVMSCY